MTDELTKAAKECQASVNLGNVSIESRNAIVRFALPLLDSQLITVEWLESCGFKEYVIDLELRHEENGWSIAATRNLERWDYMGRWIKSPNTRGELRLLCLSLGIDLREPENRE